MTGKAEKIIKEIKEMIEPYCIAKKIIDQSFELKIIDCDYGIYDAWEPSPSAYSLMLETRNNTLKISINSEDGEIIIGIRSNDIKLKKFLEDFNKECIKLNTYRDPNRISTSFNNYDSYFIFQGYFYNRKDYTYNILQQILLLNS